MLTSHTEPEKVFHAFTAGAHGYCTKNVKSDRLATIIDMLLDGVIWLDPAIAGYIVQEMPRLLAQHTQPDPLPQNLTPGGELTPRELDILRLIAQGRNNKDIAEALTISVFTVKNHVSNIIQKLAVEDRTQAAIVALKHQL